MKKQKMKISKSTKIYIRREKEKIRQMGVGSEEEQKRITKLYEGFGISKPTELAKSK